MGQESHRSGSPGRGSLEQQEPRRSSFLSLGWSGPWGRSGSGEAVEPLVSSPAHVYTHCLTSPTLR